MLVDGLKPRETTPRWCSAPSSGLATPAWSTQSHGSLEQLETAMEQIGKGSQAVVEHLAKLAASQGSHSSLPTRSIRTDSPPALLERYTDYELRRLYSAWRPDRGPREIVRALEPGERAALAVRDATLRAGLAGYHPSERDRVKAQVGAMLGGFRSMRQTDVDVAGALEAAAAVLRAFPLWAITKGCLQIARGETDLDRHWPPNDSEIHDVVARVVQPYRSTLEVIDGLLTATVRPQPLPPPPVITPPNDVRPFGADPSAPLIEPRQNDGQHAARVAAQLAAKRAEREAPPELAALIKAGMA
jgi:hypothetical protein